MNRRLLILILALSAAPLLLVAAFYAQQNWTSHLEWQQAKDTLLSIGEPLEIAELQSSPVADADNMALAPVFRDLFIFNNPADAAVNAIQLPRGKSGRAPSDPAIIQLAHRFQTDFTGNTQDAARVVLAGIAPMSPMLDAIASAAERPDAAWPVDYNVGVEVKLPFLSPLRSAAEVLAARGTAAINSGDSASALDDLKLIFRLAGCSNETPLIVACIFRVRILDSALRVIREGLVQGAWSESDLAVIDHQLSQFRPLDTFRESIRGERVLFLASVDSLTHKAAPYFSFIDFRTELSEKITRGISDFVWNLRPSGWAAKDRATYVNFSQEWLTHVIHNNFVRPWALTQWNEQLRNLRRNHLRFFQTPVSALALPAFSNVARMACHSQAQIDLTRLACAIERHRKETGHIPTDLAALSPAYLESMPRDVIGGGRYFYTPEGIDSYRLYGRGWNGRDDGGVTGTINPLLGLPAAKDWVWEMPAIAAEQASLTPAP